MTQILRVGVSRKSAQFSLLEIIIVLVILSTIMALVVPRLGVVPWGIRRAEFLKNINSAFHMASSVASATGHPAKLIIDINEAQIRIERGGKARIQSADTDEIGFRQQGSIFDEIEKFLLPAGTTQDPNSFLINDENEFLYRFFPNGEAVGPRLEILISGTHPLTIDVDRLTGRPLITENEN